MLRRKSIPVPASTVANSLKNLLQNLPKIANSHQCNRDSIQELPDKVTASISQDYWLKNSAHLYDSHFEKGHS